MKSTAEPCEAVSVGTFETVLRAEVDAPLLESDNRHAKATRLRIPNKTQWALRDMLDAAQKGRGQMEAMLKWIEAERLDAKGRYDKARLARLGELSALVAELALYVGELERLASDARVGIYEPGIGAAERKATNGQ